CCGMVSRPCHNTEDPQTALPCQTGVEAVSIKLTARSLLGHAVLRGSGTRFVFHFVVLYWSGATSCRERSSITQPVVTCLVGRLRYWHWAASVWADSGRGEPGLVGLTRA